MLELHWTRPELEAADPADVVGIRHGLFVRSLQETLTRDFAGERGALERVDMEPKQRERAERKTRRDAVMSLRRAEAAVAELRRLLELDRDDDAELEDVG